MSTAIIQYRGTDLSVLVNPEVKLLEKKYGSPYANFQQVCNKIISLCEAESTWKGLAHITAQDTYDNATLKFYGVNYKTLGAEMNLASAIRLILVTHAILNEEADDSIFTQRIHWDTAIRVIYECFCDYHNKACLAMSDTAVAAAQRPR